MVKRKVLLALITCFIIMLNSSVSKGDDSVRFFVSTDFHTHHWGSHPNAIDAAFMNHGIEDINKFGIDFFVNTGDNTAELALGMQKTVQMFMIKQEIPSFHVSGDHDPMSMDTLPTSMDDFIKQLSAPWDWYMLKDNILFIFLGSFGGGWDETKRLDSQALGGLSIKQRIWMKHLLNKFHDCTTILLSHIAPYDTTKLCTIPVQSKTRWFMDLEWWEQIFTDNPQFKMTFHGHDHAEAYDDGTCGNPVYGKGSLVEKNYGGNISVHVDVEEVCARYQNVDYACDPVNWVDSQGKTVSPIQNPLVTVDKDGISLDFWNFTSQTFDDDDAIDYTHNFTTSFDSMVPTEIGIPEYLIDTYSTQMYNYYAGGDRYVEFVGVEDTNIMPDPDMREVYWWDAYCTICTDSHQAYRCWGNLSGIDMDHITKADGIGRKFAIDAGDIGGKYWHDWKYTRWHFPVVGNKDWETSLTIFSDSSQTSAVRLGYEWRNASETIIGSGWSNYYDLTAGVTATITVNMTSPAGSVYGYPIIQFNKAANYWTDEWRFELDEGTTTTVNPSISVNGTPYTYSGSLADYEWTRIPCPVDAPSETITASAEGNQYGLYQIVYVDPQWMVFNAPADITSESVDLDAQRCSYSDRILFMRIPMEDDPPSGQYDIDTSNVNAGGADILFNYLGRHPSSVDTTIRSNPLMRTIIDWDPTGGVDTIKFHPDITIEPPFGSVSAIVSISTISVNYANSSMVGMVIKGVDRALDINNNGTSKFIIQLSTGTVDIVISDFQTTYKRWQETSTESSVLMSHAIWGFNPGVDIGIRKNGEVIDEVSSDGSGKINFNYTGGFSTIVLEAIELITDSPVKIINTAEPTYITNDGVSISTITATINDWWDNPVTTATNILSFSVSSEDYAVLDANTVPPLSITNIWELSAEVYVTAQIVEGNQYYLNYPTLPGGDSYNSSFA